MNSKRELFERIAEKKKKDTDFDKTKLKESEIVIGEVIKKGRLEIKPAPASGVTRGFIKLKPSLDTPSIEGKLKTNINTSVAANLTSFAGFSTVGETLEHWDRCHLPPDLETMEKVEGESRFWRDETN